MYLWHPENDVLLFLVDLVSCERIVPLLKFSTGNGTKKWKVDIFKRVKVIGHHKCQGILEIHNFSGTDWGGKHVGIPKTCGSTHTWSLIIMLLPLTVPGNLVKILFLMSLLTVSSSTRHWSKFVCNFYSLTGSTTLSSLRWEMFRSKNLEGETLPPTLPALPYLISSMPITSQCEINYTRQIALTFDQSKRIDSARFATRPVGLGALGSLGPLGHQDQRGPEIMREKN